MTNVTKPRARPTVPELERPVHSVPADDLLAAGKRLRDAGALEVVRSMREIGQRIA